MTKRLAWGGVVIALAGAVIFYFFPSDERVIRKELRALASEVNDLGTERDLARMATAARATRHFTEDVVIVPGEPFPEIRGRDGLMAVMAKPFADASYRLEFVDVQVTFGQDRQQASVYLTAKVTGLAKGPDEADVDAREMQGSVRKTGGRWLISRAEAVNTLAPPASEFSDGTLSRVPALPSSTRVLTCLLR